MPRIKRVKITKDGTEAYCMPVAVPAWERNGWTRADDGSSEEPVPAESVAPTTKKTAAKKATKREAD
jgi:hypothetical protein